MLILSKEFDEKAISDLNYDDKTLHGIKEAIPDNIDKLQKYKTLLYKCKRELLTVQENVDDIYKHLYQKYKTKSDYVLSTAEIKLYILAQTKYKTKNMILSLKKLEIDKVEDVIASLKLRGFAIKSSLEIYKEEQALKLC